MMLRKNISYLVSIALAGMAGHYFAWNPEILEVPREMLWSLGGVVVILVAIAILFFVAKYPTWWGTLIAFAMGVIGTYLAWPILSLITPISLLWFLGVIIAAVVLWSLTILDSLPHINLPKVQFTSNPTTSAKE